MKNSEIISYEVKDAELFELIGIHLQREFIFYQANKLSEIRKNAHSLEKCLDAGEEVRAASSLVKGDTFILVMSYPRDKNTDVVCKVKSYESRIDFISKGKRDVILTDVGIEILKTDYVIVKKRKKPKDFK